MRSYYLYEKIKKVIFLLFFCMSEIASAQNIVVRSMELNIKDASASTMARIDDEGKACALLKVAAVQKNLVFTGDIVGDIENKTNEYWVYMKSGSQYVMISSLGSPSIKISFRDYGMKSLQSKSTYNIVLVCQSETKDGLSHDDLSTLSYDAYKTAAQSGDPSAIVNIGKCYMYGLGISENSTEATRCFERAAKKGNLEAMHLMGNCYHYGLGVIRNDETAVEYYTKAVSKGYVPSMYALGLCYEQGLGVKQNTQKAVMYFKKAAKQGSLKSQEKLREMNKSW